MVLCWVQIFLLFSFFHLTILQCNETCVNEYQSVIHDTSENAKIIFEDILKKYGESDELEKLLRKLNESIIVAEENINVFENINEEIRWSNDELNMKIQESTKNLKDLEELSEGLNLSEMAELLKNTSRVLNIVIRSDFVTMEDLVKIVTDLSFWYGFLRNMDKNITDDLTDIPNSLQNDLYELELLLGNEETKECYGKFQDDLNLILKDFPKLLDLENTFNNVSLLEANSKRDKNIAEDIFKDTENIINEEKKLRKIFYLTNDTVHLAEETDAFKTLIDELSKNRLNIWQIELDNLEETFNAKMSDLVKKYEVDKYWNLLNELQHVAIEANEQEDSIPEVVKQIEGFIDNIECYTQFIVNCRYKTPLELEKEQVSPQCAEKIKSLALI